MLVFTDYDDLFFLKITLDFKQSPWHTFIVIMNTNGGVS